MPVVAACGEAGSPAPVGAARGEVRRDLSHDEWRGERLEEWLEERRGAMPAESGPAGGWSGGRRRNQTLVPHELRPWEYGSRRGEKGDGVVGRFFYLESGARHRAHTTVSPRAAIGLRTRTDDYA
jgi:hypothetical protein